MSSSNMPNQAMLFPEETGENICFQIRDNAAANPDKHAIIYSGGNDKAGRQLYGHITYGQLEEMSDRCAWGLVKAGIRRGTKTILLAQPDAQLFPIFLSLIKIGAAPVVVDAGMGLKRMLRCLASVDAEAFIGIPIAHMLRILNPWYFRSIKTCITVGRSFWGGHTLKEIFNTPWKPYPIAALAPDDIFAIMFTTGSTGPAKGVPYTQAMVSAQAEVFLDFLKINKNSVDLATFPVFAVYDLINGGTAVLPDMDFTKPAHVDPVKILGAIKDHKVTHTFASPALLNRVGRYAQGKKIALPSLTKVLSGGAPVSSAIIERFLPLLPPSGAIYATYGATECLPISALGSSDILSETAHLSKQGRGTCVGKPLLGVEARIIRITDDPIPTLTDDIYAPQGEIGEIILRAPHVSKSYYMRPEADSIGKIQDNGSVWHRMGDVGWIDEKGRIWFCGRKKHRVTTGKGDLFTIPCESIFNNHPLVARSALVGVKNGLLRSPVICIELEPDAKGTDRKKLAKEIIDLGQAHDMTSSINTILIYPGSFPVDIRHNAKIFREEIAVWAGRKLADPSLQADSSSNSSNSRVLFPKK